MKHSLSLGKKNLIRRKHKNGVQDEIFLEFMRRNEDIGRGFVKGDTVLVDAKWANGRRVKSGWTTIEKYFRQEKSWVFNKS